MRAALPLFALFTALTAGPAPMAHGAAGAKPNFVFILGEATGWSNTSIRIDERRQDARDAGFWTPNLERLAREGVRFSDFYAASPRCTPSRASYFTGISPARLHMTYINRTGQEDERGRGRPGARPVGPPKLLPPAPEIELPRGVETIGSVLKAEGYTTAHFGKWHVGRVSPLQHGFDETDGANGNEGPERVPTPNPRQAYALTERGLAFMESQAKAGKPFYLQLSHYPGRSAEEALPETRKEMEARFGVRNGRQAAQKVLIADMDKTIGLVLKKLDELGVADRTYVIFSADHGAQDDGANAPLAGGKGSLKEGGVRVPFLVRGPGIKPGTRSPVRGIGWDLLPTLAALAGRTKPLPAEVEGGSLAAVLRGGTEPVQRPREELVTHFPHYDLGNGGPASAIYLGRYKLIRLDETGTSALFDLETDPSESTDLARMLPAKTAELEARLRSYLTDVKAQLATPNPSYRAEPKPD